MKKNFLPVMILLLAILTASCVMDDGQSQPSESSVVPEQSQQEESAVEDFVFTGTESFNNKNMMNTGKMGDSDGPAYCVYSNKGYNKAAFEVELSEIDLNIYRNGTAQHVNAYIFLGIDIYAPEGDWWVNCVDTGLVYSSDTNGWHVFYNMYMTEQDSNRWYESSVSLDSDHDYRLQLDSSSKENQCTLTVYDITEQKVADSVTFEAAMALPDGSNTGYLMNFALDYPNDIRLDTDGNVTDNWLEITKYNSDCGMYMKNIRVKNAVLYDSEGEHEWTKERTICRGIWPDGSMDLGYVCTYVEKADENKSFIVSLDLNSK